MLERAAGAVADVAVAAQAVERIRVAEGLVAGDFRGDLKVATQAIFLQIAKTFGFYFDRFVEFLGGESG